ncbi:hypothetical protein, partial [Enhygromyxa salina]|uniref:hypothetical protein n=1 Tax=Enhygromyxa salina TaxID=215803 RepID=UPI001C630BB6
MNIRLGRFAFVLAMTLGFGLGVSSCVDLEENVEHCWWAEGNTTCAYVFGDERPFCTWNEVPCGVVTKYGCVAHRPARDECYSPCGGGVTAAQNQNSCWEETTGAEEGDGDG